MGWSRREPERVRRSGSSLGDAGLHSPRFACLRMEPRRPETRVRFDHTVHWLEVHHVVAMTLEQERSVAAGPGADPRVAYGEFLLVCEAIPASDTVGSWHFCLETPEGETVLDVREKELADPNRLALLAVVRGLEAIEGNGWVTLVSTSRYVIRGLRDSLHRWRENGFVWEQFGRIAPIQNADLWRRVDHALGFHQVNACLLSATQVSGQPPATATAGPDAPGAARGGQAAGQFAGQAAGPKSSDRLRRWLFAQCHAQQPAPRRRYGPADLALA